MTPFTHIIGRAPFCIGGEFGGEPYMRRWWLIPRNKRFNIYLHQFLHSDDARALHTHPWSWNLSILIRGTYVEHTENGSRRLAAPAFVFRRGEAAHMIELPAGGRAWTIFVMGRVVREWGFRCPQGFVHWRAFTSPSDKGKVGKGCVQ